MRSWRRFRRKWRRWSQGQRMAFVVAVTLGPLMLLSIGKATYTTPAAPASPPASNQALGQQLAGPYGWGSGPQWACLDALWAQESSWSNTADNSQSGAYGIPQALPPTKMPAAALPPQNSASVQIAWGLGYIDTTYGTPCNAWGHEEADGWY
jgi:hypothetical protein